MPPPGDLLGGLTEVQQLVLRDQSAQAFEALLGLVLEVTDSEYGFVGEILHDDEGAPYLLTRALTNIAWDEESRQFYESRKERGLEFRNLDTLFGCVLRTAEPVVANDPSTDPRRGGVPANHRALNAFLGLPIKSEGEPVGMLGLANRPGGYAAGDIEGMRLLLEHAALMIVNARRDEARKAALDALRESRAQSQAVLDAALDAILTIDDEGTVLAANAATRRLFGYEPEELVGRNVRVLMPEPFSSEHTAYIHSYLRTGEAKIIGIGREVIALHKGGAAIPIDLAVTEVKLDGRSLFTGIARDLSDRKAAERAAQRAADEVRRSHDNLLAVLDQMRVGTVILDASGRVTHMSAGEGLPCAGGRGHLVGERWQSVLGVDDRSVRAVEDMIRRPESKRTRVTVSWPARDAAACWAEVEIKDDPRTALGRILYFYDTTEVHALRERLRDVHQGLLVGSSEPMQELYRSIAQVAAGDWTVLIDGETGSGKELVARAIHRASKRAGGPFLAFNCAGGAEALLASQLFGHRRGAFTGAERAHEGLFEAASSGSLLLDEIGDIPPSMQVLLLRVLEEREVLRVGENVPRSIDVRVICATHRNLAAEVKAGRFREDLLYRIRVARVRVPPLRERLDDVPLLVEAFLAQERVSAGKPVTRVDPEAMDALMGYPWPGNVRELKHVIDYAAIHSTDAMIHVQDLPPEVLAGAEAVDPSTGPAAPSEEERIRAAIRAAGGNRSRAARLLGISRATLYRSLTRLGIEREGAR